MTDTAFTDEQPGLFDIDPSQVRVAAPDPFEGLSADRRRTLRQAMDLEAGRHPLTGGKLHEDASPVDDRKADGRRCGNCWFLTARAWRDGSFLKCGHPGGLGADEISLAGPSRVTRGAASDVRRWWPACADHVYGDTRMSDDAARWVPEAVAL